MKGIVFNEFNELVEAKFGLEMWENLLNRAQPPSGGIYTSGETYNDSELISLVDALSHETKIPIPDLVKVFGQYLAASLTKLYPQFTEGKSLKEFLKSIHDVVHVEVRKIHPDAELPSFDYEDPGENLLVMIYKSPRKLCQLAEGLIEGAAKVYQKKISLNHPKCLHSGDDHCRLEIEFSG